MNSQFYDNLYGSWIIKALFGVMGVLVFSFAFADSSREKPKTTFKDIGGVISYIKASSPGIGDLFGYSLSLSGDGSTLAVGAYGEDSNASGIDGDQENNEAERSGAVYVFTRNKEGQWEQQTYLKASNTEEWDSFGRSLSLSGDGNTLAVGAYREDSNARGLMAIRKIMKQKAQEPSMSLQETKKVSGNNRPILKLQTQGHGIFLVDH